MLKESIRFPLLFFTVSILWQLIAKKQVQWIDHVGVSFIMFLIFLVYHWAKRPYKWKQDKEE